MTPDDRYQLRKEQEADAMRAADIKGLEERLRFRAQVRKDADHQAGRHGKEWAIETYMEWQAADALRTLTTERDEARAERDRTKLHMSAWEDSARINKRRAEEAENELTRHRHYNFDWKARAEAAEARLEELTRERDEANADRCFHNDDDPACKLEHKFVSENEKMRARLEEAKAVLERAANDFDTLAENIRKLPVWSTTSDHCGPHSIAFVGAKTIRAFLQPTGGTE